MAIWPTLSTPCLNDREQRRHAAIAALLLAFGYFLGARAGFALTLKQVPVALLWPPNAVLLSGLLLSPKRLWPVLIAAALPAHVLAEMSAQVPLTMMLCWFVSNVTEALVGALAIHAYLHRAPQFDRFRDLVVFLIGAPFLGTFVSSFLDAAMVVAVGWRDSDFWIVWRTRLLSNMLATLTLVPLIVNLAQTRVRYFGRRAVRDIVETAALLVGLWGTCALVFWKSHPEPNELMLTCLPVPFLAWAAMRLGVSGVSLCVASVAAFAISGVLEGRGPFTLGDPLSDAMALQVFLIIVAASLLLQCASLGELRNARHIAVQRGERLRLALAAARMGIWDWEVGAHRLTWSDSASDFAGQEQDETTLTGLLQRIHPDDRSRVSDAFTAISNGGDKVDVEFRWWGRGDVVWSTAIGKVERFEGGRRILGVHMDVSERKQQELHLREQREQLWHLSRVAMLGDLSGALAHELSQPMTAILANAQVARGRLPEGAVAEAREIIEDIVSETKRAADVIRQLRALFARGASAATSVDINECVRGVLSLGHSHLVSCDIDLQLQLAPALPRVRVDNVQLQQVLLNLILNACEAMSANTPDERYMRITTCLSEEGDVSIEVYDRGVGIGDVDRIFEPYFTTKNHGLGLGLAICHTIVSAHRGRLWATNNLDRGATMHIVLPAENAPAAPWGHSTAPTARVDGAFTRTNVQSAAGASDGIDRASSVSTFIPHPTRGPVE